VIELTPAEIAAAIGGRVVGDASAPVSGTVHTDSRLVEPGDLFVALRGESDDGHRFAPGAVERGAALLVVERELDLPVPQIVVPDGLTALSALAQAVVQRVREGGQLRVLAVTGSNGKTTTKNMLRAILERQGETVAPAGSFNNQVGAPVSMLRITASTRFLIVEMGADGLGDVASLVAIARPDVGIVLKVGYAHIGKFGDLDTIERAKGEMVADLPPEATAVLNADDPRVTRMPTAARVVRFGLDEAADVRALDVRLSREGTVFTATDGAESAEVTLRILGEHHVSNALAAITAARAVGVPISRSAEALGTMERAERWRMEVLQAPEGWTVINDAYNASPDSMAAALKTLAQVGGEGRTFAVLGQMAELGDHAVDEHDRIGRLVVRLGIHQLVVVGQEARTLHKGAELEGSWDGESLIVDDVDSAYDVMRDRLRPGDVVLVKASNVAGLRALGDRLAGVAE
jgi:UDP-N-acetylmuramoyl-tripeptide--D-alanyl-D-alanine ligase